MEPPAEEEHTGPLPNQSSPRNIQIGNLSNQLDPGTTSSPPNDLETGGPESATHNTGAEDHKFRTSFESLCLKVNKQLSGLRRSDFNDESNYRWLRTILHLPPEAQPETAHTVINVHDHEGT
ncbi:hypothetical protein AGABI1DRAFT_101970 [Agaricus bisporus var. burnettii JB137-S8]|uniref:Uncharacterized protein n=1 Tax=Agaricus bisporus var. burnettii (strain JB137-S8 / ATCC MYA-4627 / FGSC 10392) TaxID=597362 RepID=K5XQE9_AGABU|nr:uncharacterized protein AGABI1DRAFT_101970 [Agaricus bisporus var. burnettii JB137-S8]EKM77020.1 hypothetical protein AGABI1DRAFT_101970 [Agaricus bisporus var. burnettii JB137-S8]